jgi:uncharacterized repeat protein (TIGR03847 family)
MDERIELDLRPTTHLTTDAIGPPGERVFYIQGVSVEHTVTLIVEKFQIQTLGIAVEQFLAEVYQKFPDMQEASAQYIEEEMRIHPPIDPLFRVGELGLGYDADNDLVALVAREIMQEDENEENASVVRFWCTRTQLRSMVHWGMEVATRGRSIDTLGYFDPRKNGHKH